MDQMESLYFDHRHAFPQISMEGFVPECLPYDIAPAHAQSEKSIQDLIDSDDEEDSEYLKFVEKTDSPATTLDRRVNYCLTDNVLNGQPFSPEGPQTQPINYTSSGQSAVVKSQQKDNSTNRAEDYEVNCQEIRNEFSDLIQLPTAHYTAPHAAEPSSKQASCSVAGSHFSLPNFVQNHDFVDDNSCGE